MKYILRTFLGICCISNFSCTENFLDKSDPTALVTDKFYSNDTEIEQAVNGIYGQLQGIVNDQWIFNELITDNTTVDFNPNDRGQADRMEAFEYFSVNSGSVNINSMYVNTYNAIYNINNTLLKLANSESVTASLKTASEGQLKFLRAYYYFELVQYFGDVILITEPIDLVSEAWDYARESPDVVYAQIQTDLTDAVELLPPSWGANQVGRITKGAALTLLGKVYLTRKQYPEAISTLEKVPDLGYALLPDYADVFSPQHKNSVESIFEVQYQGDNDLGEHSGFIYTFAPRLSGGAVTGWPQSNPGGWNIPTNDLINAYEEGDERKAASVGLDFTSSITNKLVPYIKKYDHDHSIYGRTDDNWPVLRYADVLLMLAEAINEQDGPGTEAYDYLNEVRERAGLDPVSGLGQAAFRERVLHERRVELAFENWRWFDLKRTKTTEELVLFLNNYAATEKANPTVSRQGIPFSGSDYIFSSFEAVYPIPNNEILVNDKLTQNQDY